MQERWRSIKGYEGIYEVSSLGRVRRLTWRNGQVNKSLTEPTLVGIKPDCWGYPTVRLWKDNTMKSCTVHRLVLLAFYESPPGGCEAAHLNGNQQDCDLHNLAWVTKKENEYHKKLHGTACIGGKNASAKLTPEKVLEIRDLVDRGIPKAHVARLYKVSESLIRRISKRQVWAHVVREEQP
jgi:hypothetical protein